MAVKRITRETSQPPTPRSPHSDSACSVPSHGHASTLHAPLDPSHDKVLTDETSDDNDFTVQDGIFDVDDIASNADAGSIIGVSIGQNQSLMKSPNTPAATKVQALESSMTCFVNDADIETQIFDEPLGNSTSEDRPLKLVEASEPSPNTTDSIHEETLPLLGDKHKHEKRTSLVSTILGAASNKPRQRTSSGSLWMDSIRKMLPTMPSISQAVSAASNRLEDGDTSIKVLGPAGPGTVRQTWISSSEEKRLNDNRSSSNSKDLTLSSSASGSGPAKDSRNADMFRPKPLRRVTSDQSLYIRRAPTGGSQFDDYNNFSNVSDMVNSRFKAISDTFQDSSLRMPKLPNMSWGVNSGSPDTAKSSTISSNTKASPGVSKAKALESARNKESKTFHATDSSRHPIIKDALSQLSGDLVILGGYRGSVLREAQTPHRQLWVPVKVGLNLRKADLEVGLTREDELKMENTIIADGTLSHIGPVDICRRLIKKCRKCSNVKENKLRVHDYGYDWRLSPDLLADRYIKFLEALPCNQKHLPPSERGAWIIAHSLGGLITRNVINRRPELFAGVVYAGTPQNCVNILGPLRNGDDVLFSSRVLTAQVNFTLRTSYALLPENGRCFINKHTKERYDLDFFDVKTWEEYRLSPCIKPAIHRQKPAKRLSMLGHPADSQSSSMASRYNSWFSTTSSKLDTVEDPSTTTSNNKSVPQKLKDQATTAKDEIANTAELAAAQNKPDGPLSPTLSDAQHSRPSIATTVTIPLPAATEYLSRTLSQTLHFKQSLSHNQSFQSRNAYPPLSILFAKNTPTVYGAFIDSREAIKYEDAFEELAFAAGDGVVLASAAQLPLGYRCVRGGRVESERGHVGLLGDLEGVGRCLVAIVEGRRRGVGLGSYQEKEGVSK